MSDSEDDFIVKPAKRRKISRNPWTDEDSSESEEEVIKGKSYASARPIDSTSEESMSSDNDESESDHEDGEGEVMSDDLSGSGSEEDVSDTEDSSSESENDDPDRDPNAINVWDTDSEEDNVERYGDDNDLDLKQNAIGQEDIKAGPSNQGDGYESSSGDENSICCAICLSKLNSSKLPSRPDSGCEHMFCRECLTEWSKQVSHSIDILSRWCTSFGVSFRKNSMKLIAFKNKSRSLEKQYKTQSRSKFSVKLTL